MTDDLDNFPLDAIFSKTGTSNHVFFNVILKKNGCSKYRKLSENFHVCKKDLFYSKGTSMEIVYMHPGTLPCWNM